jgi:dipeptidyl-peptidase-4
MIPYPKAGTTNSAVTVGVVDVQSAKTTWMDVIGDPRQNYIARLEWAGNSNELAIEQLNRLQNTARLLIGNAASGNTRPIFEDTDKAWVDVNEIRPIEDSFVWLSERDGWRHAYLIHRDGSGPTLLTPGKFDVIGLINVSAQQHAIYFSASPENATQSYLYRAAALGNSGDPVRLTPANQPGFHGYRIAPNGEWAIHTFSRFDDPSRVDLVRINHARSIRSIVDNDELRNKTRPLLENRSEFFQVDIGNGITLDGWMIRPRSFDPSRTISRAGVCIR